MKTLAFVLLTSVLSFAQLKATVKKTAASPSVPAGQHSVVLTWTQSSQPAGVVLTGDIVKRSTTNGGPYTVLFTSTTPITTYTDSGTGVLGGTTYYYVVDAVCATCTPTTSADSNQATAVVPPDTPGQPAPPVLGVPVVQ